METSLTPGEELNPATSVIVGLAAPQGPSTPITSGHVESATVVLQKCTRCPYIGAVDSFPTKRSGLGYVKVCTACTDKQVGKKAFKTKQDIEAPRLKMKEQLPASTMVFDEFLSLVAFNKTRPFDFDTMVNIPSGMFANGEHMYTRTNRIRDHLADASDFHWNQKKTKRGGKSTVVTYFCAQLEGEQSKGRAHDDDVNRRKSRSRLIRYNCGGWLRITLMDENELLVRIRMTHAMAHPSFPASLRRAGPSGNYNQDEAMESVAQTPLEIPRSSMSKPPLSLPRYVGFPPPPIPRSPSPPPPAAENTEHSESGEEEDDAVQVQCQEHSPDADHLGVGESGDSCPVILPTSRMTQLKRSFDSLLDAAKGTPTPMLAGKLLSVFDHIEQTAKELEEGPLAKRRRL